MIDYKELGSDGEQWELFARDFLSEIGYIVESPPNRGADQGRDLMVIENLEGHLANYPFRWLVSCKNNAVSGKAVSEEEEKNLLERMRGFQCDGFMGFYSTIPSAGLNNRLTQLREKGELKDFQVFDSRRIEGYLIKVGYSKLVMRYFPKSYKVVKPLHLLTDKYIPLECASCGKDILQELSSIDYRAVIALANNGDQSDGAIHVEDVYWACKGECDRTFEGSLYETRGLITGWEDISDLLIPAWYMKWILTIINELHSGSYKYSEPAWKKMKEFILAMGQRVLREMTDNERKRVVHLLNLPSI